MTSDDFLSQILNLQHSATRHLFIVFYKHLSQKTFNLKCFVGHLPPTRHKEKSMFQEAKHVLDKNI